MTIENLDFLFRPRSIAVIGASSGAGSVGGALMRNLLAGGFRGPILPVNPRRDSVAGVRAYRAVARLPETPDLGLVCTPAETVPDVIHALGELGTRAAAILTRGSHAADERAKLRQAVLAAASQHSMRILGPNSMGLILPSLGLNASVAATPVLPGAVAFVSQSGALTAAALDWAATRHIGFSHVVSLGDAVDVDAEDVLDYLGSDPVTRAVLLHLEFVSEGRRFLSAARAASRGKPVIVLKSGRTAAGAQAVIQHTGRHPGDDAVFGAAVSRAGMVRVDTIAELFAASETLARTGSFKGDRLIILTNAGGPGVIAVDTLEEGGGDLAWLDLETAGRLREMMPDVSVAANPIDIGGDADASRYAISLETILAAPGPDAVLVIHGPSGVAAARQIAEACAKVARDSPRTILACWMGGERARKSAQVLQEAGIAAYETPERAVRAFLHIVEFRRNQEALQQAPPSRTPEFAPDETAVRNVLHQALSARHHRLTDPEGKQILAAYGIPVVETFVAATADEAVKLARQIGYPVALKVLSPDLEHRADVGGIMLNIEYENQLRTAADDIARRMRQLRPDARLAGFTVQPMIRTPGAVTVRHGAHELSLRVAEDAVFGLVATLRRSGADSRGHTAVELLPLNPALAREAIVRSDLPSDLSATAGRPAADLDAISHALARVSQLLVDNAEILELEIDPLLADEKGVMALEVRTRVGPPTARRGPRLAIRPYPRELEQSIDLPCGRHLLRPIRPEDAGAYAEFIARTHAPDVRLRFFRLVRNLPAKDLARYTQIDYDREMAFVAVRQEEPGKGEITGEVRAFIYRDDATAEFAILVRSDVMRGGLGRALLSKMIEYCRASGVAELIGQILSENEAMIALARRCGMQVEEGPGTSIAIAHLDLRAAEPTSAPRI
jgi:acetyltransferase